MTPTDKLSEHFTYGELACRCGCGLVPPDPFVSQLEALRVAFGQPMAITSGARCPAHNVAVSTTGTTGPHVPLSGRYCAVDVGIYGPHVWSLLESAFVVSLESHKARQRTGWYGVGLRQHGPMSQRIVHLDNHWNGAGIPRPRVWTYPG